MSSLKDCKLSKSKREELKALNNAGKTPRRVKVYLLNGDDWIDNGTGFCVGEIDDDTKLPYFLVRNETDNNNIILKSFLEGSIQYQRQQETLIVWTDSNGTDLALSFQETEGCADLCDFIIRVQQGNISPGISLYYVIPNINEGDDITELITGPIRYPPEIPNVENLDVVLETINQGTNAQFTRTNILEFIIENDYFTKLINVFNEAENNENANVLYNVSDIVKSLFLYNESLIIEYILSSEEKILGLVGILEYDSEYPNYKASHRNFLASQSYIKVIPVENIEIFKRDFYLNYLKDVVLARFLDDSTFNLIASLIYSNHLEIFNYIKDSEILEHLFSIYDNCNDEKNECNSIDNDDDNDDDNIKMKQRDGVKMLHQYVLIAKSLRKHDFFALLVKHGLLKMINFALNDKQDQIRVLGTELIVIIIEQDVSLVNSIDHEETTTTIDNSDPPILEELVHNNKATPQEIVEEEEEDIPSITPKEGKLRLSDDMTLISILSKLLVEDKNIGLKMQAFEALKTLLDPNIAASSSGGSNGLSPTTMGGMGTPNGSGSNSNSLFNSSNANANANVNANANTNTNTNSVNKSIGINTNNIEEFKFTSEEFQEINTSTYFRAFYEQVAPKLFEKLIILANHNLESKQLQINTKHEELLYQLLCELISFCTLEHKMISLSSLSSSSFSSSSLSSSLSSRSFFIENHIPLGIAKLLIIDDCKPILKLTSIRCLKNLILLNDEFYTRYFINHDLWFYFFKFFNNVIDENNLANSTCLDFIEIVIKGCDIGLNNNNNNNNNNNSKRSNYILLAKHIYKKYGEFIEKKLNYVDTGKRLIDLVTHSLNSNSNSNVNKLNGGQTFNENNNNNNKEEYDEDDNEYDNENEDSDENIATNTDDLGLSEDEMLPHNASTPINDEEDEAEQEGTRLYTDVTEEIRISEKKRPREESDEIKPTPIIDNATTTTTTTTITTTTAASNSNDNFNGTKKIALTTTSDNQL